MRGVWARLREMTPTNRHDELSELLYGIRQEVMENLPENLIKMLKIANLAISDMQKNLNTIQPSENEHTVEQWYAKFFEENSKDSHPWEEDYARLVNSSEQDEGALRQMERTHNILRWERESASTKYWFERSIRRDLEKARINLAQKTAEYDCYVGIMRGHSENHNYAARRQMSNAILTAAKIMHESCSVWNGLRHQLGFPPLTMAEIRKREILASTYRSGHDRVTQHNFLLWEWGSLKKRAEEERVYVRNEMRALIRYGQLKVAILSGRVAAGDLQVCELLERSRLQLWEWTHILKSALQSLGDPILPDDVPTFRTVETPDDEAPVSS